jgi:predicted nucleotidyltransferase
MADPITAMRAVADRLEKLGLNYAFVGGSIVNLLLDNPGFSPARPTDDVDVIVGVLTSERYSDVEARIRELGFTHDMREGAPLCRWCLAELTVDIMPTDGASIGLNTMWFAEVLATADEKSVRGDIRLRIVSPVGFLATKLVAFSDRGKGDYYGSQDIEDVFTVIDGRAAIVAEVEKSPKGLRRYIRDSFRFFVGRGDFQEAAAGALPSDDAGQARLPSLRRKFAALSELPD